MKPTTAKNCLSVLAIILLAGMRHTPAIAEAWSSHFDGFVGEVPVSVHAAARISAGPFGGFFAYRYLEPGNGLSGMARLDPATGATLWSALDPIDFEGQDANSSHVALADGSSILLSQGLSRFAPDGALIWTVPSDTGTAIAQLHSGELLFAARSGTSVDMRRLSVGTGATVETIQIPQFAACQRLALSAATSDVAYLWCRDIGLAKISIAPLRVMWSVADGAVDVVADAAGVYENAGSVLRKRSVSDGSILWEVPHSGSFPSLQLDAAGNLIKSGPTNIERRDSQSGSVLWSSSESGRPRLDADRQGIYFIETLGATGEPTRGRVGRIDLATGATLWAQETSPTATSTFSDVAASASRVMVIGTTCETSLDSQCKQTVWATASSGGALSPSPLRSRTSTSGGTAAVGTEQTLAVASGWGLEGPQVLLRAIANDSGAVVQDSVSPFAISSTPFADLGWTSGHLLQVSREVGGHLFATYATNSLPVDGSAANSTLFKIDRSNGAITWQKFFLEQDRMAVISKPIVDSAGNVAVSAVEHFSPSVFPDRRWVRKYSGTDGSLLWEREFSADPWFVDSIYPPSIAALGDDVGVYDAPLGSGHRRFTSLSGADGSSRWSLNSDDEFVQSIGSNGVITRRSGLPLRISRIDMSSGLPIWTTTYGGYPDNAHTIYGVLHGDDGDFYIGGSIRTFDLVLNQLRTIGSLLRFDRDDGHVVWDNRLESNPVWPTSRVNPRALSNGKIYATQPLGGTLGTALTAFAADSGVSIGSSYLFSSSINQPHVSQQSDQGVVTVRAALGTLVSGQHFDAGAPGAFVVSNLGGPMPAVMGALRINLDVSPSSSGATTRYELALEAHNNGSSSVDGVNVLLALPPGAIIGTTTCTLSGSACEATVTATSLEGTFTIPAGASVRFVGSVILQGGADVFTPDHFSAYAFAPHPFTETNLEDNQARVSFFDDLIFGNGFEN